MERLPKIREKLVKERIRKMDELLENLCQTTSFNKFSSYGFLDFSYIDWTILRVQIMLISNAFGMNFPLPDISPILLQSADNALDANVEIADDYFKELALGISEYGWSLTMYSDISKETYDGSYSLPNLIFDSLSTSFISNDLEESNIYVYENPTLGKFMKKYPDAGNQIIQFLSSLCSCLFSHLGDSVLEQNFGVSKYLIVSDDNVYWVEGMDMIDNEYYFSLFHPETFIVLNEINNYKSRYEAAVGGVYDNDK